MQGDAVPHAGLPEHARQLHAFWFGNVLQEPARTAEFVTRWFKGGAQFDAELGARFADLPNRAMRGEFDHWCDTPRGWLCLLLALDQLPRNLHREDASAFAGDATALAWAERGLAKAWDQQLDPLERLFVYLPLEHSEDLAHQQRCVALTRALADDVQGALRADFDSFVLFAERHRDIIARFGRFPHRNAALGRQSTQAELQFLQQSGRGF